MAGRKGVTLYHSPESRAFTTYWLLEELGVPFQVETIDIRTGAQKSAEYLKLNPSGKVPTLADGAVVVSENPAICIYLADRYGYGSLAPRIEHADRGAYLKWMVYSTAVVEPVRDLHHREVDLPGSDFGFGDYETMVGVLTEALSGGEYLLGKGFSAADVMLGSVIVTSLYGGRLPHAAPLLDYRARLAARPAFQRAADATWPKWL